VLEAVEELLRGDAGGGEGDSDGDGDYGDAGDHGVG